jgi:hypothetical protein
MVATREKHGRKSKKKEFIDSVDDLKQPVPALNKNLGAALYLLVKRNIPISPYCVSIKVVPANN